MANTLNTPVLQLRDAEPERAFLEFAGEKYHYALQSDLRIDEIQSVVQVAKSMQGLASGDGSILDMTAEQAAQLKQLADAGCRMVMHDMPDHVHATLTDFERAAIVQGFSKALDVVNAASPAPSPTSPLASAGSTPASPLTGSVA
jgi:hypothetical protein